MGKSEIPAPVSEEERLDILYSASTGRRITDMSDGHASFEGGEVVIVEDLRHEPLAFDPYKFPFPVHRHYAATFLPPVLEGMKGVIGQFSRSRDTPNPEDSALFMQALESTHLVLFSKHRVHRILF